MYEPNEPDELYEAGYAPEGEDDDQELGHDTHDPMLNHDEWSGELASDTHMPVFSPAADIPEAGRHAEGGGRRVRVKPMNGTMMKLVHRIPDISTITITKKNGRQIVFTVD